MEYTKTFDIPGILLFIDFEKVLDSLEWNFMFKCLEVFDFGHSLVRWVETFYSNVSSCIINNGSFSRNFELSRGVRQGNPLSPYLFVIAIETLAAAIRTKIDIKGIKLDLEEWKLVQYADDLTLLSDLTSAQNLFKVLVHFGKLSGLKVNYTKTEAMWIGFCGDSIKALEVHDSYNKELSFQKNFYDKITEIKKQIHQWSWKGLSLFGKVSKSLRLAWILKIFNPEPSSWKSYLRLLLKPYGGFFFFHCNYNINDYNINSIFYLEMLQWWSEFRSNFLTDLKLSTL